MNRELRVKLKYLSVFILVCVILQLQMLTAAVCRWSWEASCFRSAHEDAASQTESTNIVNPQHPQNMKQTQSVEEYKRLHTHGIHTHRHRKAIYCTQYPNVCMKVRTVRS